MVTYRSAAACGFAPDTVDVGAAGAAIGYPAIIRARTEKLVVCWKVVMRDGGGEKRLIGIAAQRSVHPLTPHSIEHPHRRPAPDSHGQGDTMVVPQFSF